jgi:hypothetical protein
MSGTLGAVLCRDRGKRLILTDRFPLPKVEKKNRRNYRLRSKGRGIVPGKYTGQTSVN